MKFLIAFAAIVAVAYAASASDDASITLTKSLSDFHPDGSYQFEQELSNQAYQEESGSLKELKDADGKPVQVIVAKGAYRYTSPDGQPIELTYIADENGFQPQGAHLPTPPPATA